MFARIREKHLLEIRTAYREDDFMGVQQLSVASQRHVHQVSSLEQSVESISYIILEIFPTQRELFHFLRDTRFSLQVFRTYRHSTPLVRFASRPPNQRAHRLQAHYQFYQPGEEILV